MAKKKQRDQAWLELEEGACFLYIADEDAEVEDGGVFHDETHSPEFVDEPGAKEEHWVGLNIGVSCGSAMQTAAWKRIAKKLGLPLYGSVKTRRKLG